jgi:hypothetical protein
MSCQILRYRPAIVFYPCLLGSHAAGFRLPGPNQVSVSCAIKVSLNLDIFADGCRSSGILFGHDGVIVIPETVIAPFRDVTSCARYGLNVPLDTDAIGNEHTVKARSSVRKGGFLLGNNAMTAMNSGVPSICTCIWMPCHGTFVSKWNSESICQIYGQKTINFKKIAGDLPRSYNSPMPIYWEVRSRL